MVRINSWTTTYFDEKKTKRKTEKIKSQPAASEETGLLD
jgi:hypothetical protein